jgi:hypothetical protein
MLVSGHTKTAPAEAGAVAPDLLKCQREIGEGAGSRVPESRWRKLSGAGFEGAGVVVEGAGVRPQVPGAAPNYADTVKAV